MRLAVWLFLAFFCHSRAQTQYFEVLQYRGPSQCTRCQCLAQNTELCREVRPGFFLREQGCQDWSKLNGRCPPAMSYTLLFSIMIYHRYNEECGMGKECAQGEGICYRPCLTFLHITSCPTDYCQWNTFTLLCEDRSPDIATVYWRDTSTGATVTEKATEIIQRTEPAAAYFPMSFANFRKSADGFRIQGVLIENITQPEALFLQLDKDIDGMLSAAEFGRIGEVFQALSNAVSEMRTAQVAARRLQESVPKQQVTPEVCNARNPRQYYCSFDADCKEDCKACGWKSATDRAFSICVQPSPEVCYADGGQVFCPSDEQCHPPGDCQNCVDRTRLAISQDIFEACERKTNHKAC
eukprot:g15979.t1